MVKKIPMRTCVVTHEKLEKKDLVRIVRTPEKDIKIDPTMKANGRGAYLKKDLEVFQKARKTKALEKALNTEINEETYLELEEYFK